MVIDPPEIRNKDTLLWCRNVTFIVNSMLQSWPGSDPLPVPSAFDNDMFFWALDVNIAIGNLVDGSPASPIRDVPGNAKDLADWCLSIKSAIEGIS